MIHQPSSSVVDLCGERVPAFGRIHIGFIRWFPGVAEQDNLRRARQSRFSDKEKQ